MKRTRSGRWNRCAVAALAVAALAPVARGHVTLRASQPLRPGSYAEIQMVVPNERHVDTVRVTLEVPDAFLNAGGRLSRVEFPDGWRVVLEKEDKPGEVYSQEIEQRARRRQSFDHAVETESGTALASEQQILNQMRKQWIKRVSFEGGKIPPDGFRDFGLSFQLPTEPGDYRFPAIQTYADGRDISWSELVQGAEHPAPTVSLAPQQSRRGLQNLALPLSVMALALSLGAAVAQIRRRRAV